MGGRLLLYDLVLFLVVRVECRLSYELRDVAGGGGDRVKVGCAVGGG